MTDPRDELVRLREQLDEERRLTQQWREVAEERRVTLERLRQRRVVRLLLRVAKTVMPWVRVALTALHRVEDSGRGALSSAVGLRHRLGAPSRESRLLRQVGGLPTPVKDDRGVGIVILTRDGRERLEPLLDRLATLAHERAHVVVIDNGSRPDTRDWLRSRPGVTVVRNEHNASFSDACNQGAAAADGEVLLFLNDDVEPLDDDWLGRMLTQLGGDVVAVGAQLVYPRRALTGDRRRDVAVQHLGIGASPNGWGPPQVHNLGVGEDADPSTPPRSCLAATAACLLVDRGAFDAVGGFDGRYDYGAEDVDLGFRLRRAGGEIVVAPDAVLWHHEGATRHAGERRTRRERQQANWRRLADRFGPALRHAVDEDRLSGAHQLGTPAFRLGITITRDLATAGYGDYDVAHALGGSFAAWGWDVSYHQRYRDAWYEDTGDLDALIVLHDSFDVRRVARDGLTTVGWVRNWTDRWVAAPWFDRLDVVVASSAGSADRIVAASRLVEVPVVPLATDPDRFRPAMTGSRHGVVLTMNNWGHDRGVEELLRAVPDVELYGYGWEDVPSVARAWRGALDADGISALYARAEVVIDQTAGHTLRFGAVNNRVFDALAAEAAVVTNQVEGVEEVFGPGVVPTWATPDELAAVVAEVRRAPPRSLRDVVGRDHSWSARGQTFQSLIAAHRARPSVVVRHGAPNRREARTWGDTYFAEALVAEFRAAGVIATDQTLDEWDDLAGRGHDVVVHLRGRTPCPAVEGQFHVLWIISHPEEVGPTEIDAADLVLSASDTLTDRLRLRHGGRIETLLQATDHHRFRPRVPREDLEVPVLFLGNSRFVERPIVTWAVAAGLPLRIIGSNWERFVDPSLVAARFLENEDVPVAYSSAGVVLNDHWEGMRETGLVSNRIFDALACGACVVSDENPGLAGLVGDIVATVDGPASLADVIERLLADPGEREERGRRGRELVLREHTFAHRVATLRNILEQEMDG